MLRIVVIAALLVGISPVGVAQVTNVLDAPLSFGKKEVRNVTSISKNQSHPLKVEFMRDPCASVVCYSI